MHEKDTFSQMRSHILVVYILQNAVPVRGDPHILIVGDPGMGKSQVKMCCSALFYVVQSVRCYKLLPTLPLEVYMCVVTLLLQLD